MKKIIDMKFRIGFFISLLCTICGVFVAPITFDLIIETNTMLSIVIILVIGFLITAICLMISYLMFKSQRGKHTYKKVFFKMVRLGGIYTLCWFVCSMLFGVLGTLLYSMLENSLTFEQIKGIINLIVMLIVALVFPVFIHMFWAVVIDDKFTWKLSYQMYFKFMIIVFLMYGIGTIITTIFQFMPHSIVFRIMKTLILSIVGASSFTITEKVFQHEGGKM